MEKDTFEKILEEKSFTQRLKLFIQTELSPYIMDYAINGSYLFRDVTKEVKIIKHRNACFGVKLITPKYACNIEAFCDKDKYFLIEILSQIPEENFKIKILLSEFTIIMNFKNLVNIDKIKLIRLIKGE